MCAQCPRPWAALRRGQERSGVGTAARVQLAALSARSTPLRERLHRSLTAFGGSVLTRRERQVVELVLLGHNTRLIAEKLGISIETVKLHRKHAYAKLDISSQAELFFLFMEALSHWSGDPDTDPLIAYQGGQ